MTLMTLLSNAPSLLTNKYVLILAVVAVMCYGWFRIEALKDNVEFQKANIQQIEQQYDNLQVKYDTLYEDFDEFTQKVNRELEQQRISNEKIRNIDAQYRQQLQDLERSFNYDNDGNPRPFSELFDEPDVLQELINERTRGIGNEIENIGRNR